MDDAEPAGLLAGRYRLGPVIGRGGMGTVWRARDELLGRDVAVKELIWPPYLNDAERETARRRVLREAQMAARLNHPNVVGIYDIVEEEDRPWIVMELVPYPSLRDIVREDGPLTPVQAARMGLGILAALRAAHAEGIVHRDVKPANILVGPVGRVVLTDFGIARATDSPTLTATGALIGSPSYTAPERARGGQATAAGDLWALGASLYTAVEGRPPFERNGALATLTSVVADEPDPVHRAGPLWPVISALLGKDPAERLGAAQAERMLRDVAADAGATVAPPTPEAPPPGAAAGAAVVAAASDRDGGEPDAGEPDSPSDSTPAADSPPSAAPDPRARGSGSRATRTRVTLAAAAVIVVAAVGAAVAFAPGGSGKHLASGAGARPSTSATPAGSASSSASASSSVPAPSPDSSPGASSGAAGSASSVPQAASPSASAIATATAGYGALPAGYYRFTNSTGFSIGVPNGWRISHVGHYVYITDPSDGNVFLLIDQSDQPQPNPLADWQQQAANRAGSYPEYHQIALEGVYYPQAEKAADWEFTYDRDGVPVHILNLNVLANARHAYALYWSAPEADWNADYHYFEAFAATFRPAPAT